MTSVLVATRDPALLDELTRLVAAAGATLVTATDGPAAVRAWTSTVILAGVDVADELSGLAPPRRPHVHLVVRAPAVDTAFRTALAVGAEHVVELPSGAAWLVGVMTDLGDERGRPGRLVGVIGGSGGAGATTFACALAQVAARDGPAVVVDTDPLGPGADRVLGLDGRNGVRWDDLGLTAGRLGARAFRDALPRRDGVGVLTWSTGSTVVLEASVLREALSAAGRGHDLVAVDLARTPDAALEESALRCDLLVLVVRATVASVAATVRLVERLPAQSRLGLVTRGSGVDPDDVAALTGVPLLAAMSEQRRLAESVDLGLGPVRGRRGPLARAAAKVLAEVAT